MLRLFTVSIVLLIASVEVAFGQEAMHSRLQAYMDAWHQNAAFSGATLGIAFQDGSVISLATGYSDREAMTLMQPEDRLLAGSVGKTFAAAVALQLISENKIKLDDKVEKYLGDRAWFPRLPNASSMTIRHLMNHTSGLVRYEFKEQFTRDLSANLEKHWKPEELLVYLLDEQAPFEPGKGWEYSDTNYIVLGMILETVEKDTFYAMAEKRLLKPLLLTDTIPQLGPVLDRVVQGYAGKGNPFGGQDRMLNEGKMIINPQFEWTGGGYASTSANLARWAKAFYEGQAFDASLLPQVLDGVEAPMLGRGASYGLGTIIRRSANGVSYGHSGFFPGYMTEMVYFPESRIAIAVQVNSSVPKDLARPLGRVAMELLELASSPP